MRAYLKRLKLETEDRLRYSPTVRRTLARYKLWRAPSPDPRDTQAVARAINHLCAAGRLGEESELETRIQDRLSQQIANLDVARLDWSEFAPDYRDPRIAKGAILKPCLGPTEKGVIYISFEREWIHLIGVADLQAFARDYYLVIAPSSSAYNFVNYAFAAAYPTHYFTIMSHLSDRERLPRVSNRFVVVPLYTSSWGNPDLFTPLPKAERAYDLLMVAAWGKVKRHHVFFSALRSIPRDLRILLVGQEQDGRTADTIREVASWYGVADRFTILSNQPYREVTKLFCQARASIVLSKREGSCVVVAESMFADTPVAILRGAYLGSRVFINDETGRFLDEATLARDLTDFIQTADRYRPRAWAEANISCYRSSQILNDAIKAHALANGQTWTQDIAPLQWSPDPTLARPEDRVRLVPEREAIRLRFGLEIGPAPLQ